MTQPDVTLSPPPAASVRRAPAGAALAVEGLSHAFGTREVLKEVSFAIQPGEFTVLLGLNGAGKTTLFSLVTRLYDHRSGSIRIFGAEIKERPSEALARIGVVFQQPTLDLDLTVAQNLRYHAALHGLPRRLAAERIAREVERVDLTERLGHKVRQLSGGQRRRVEIARALLHQPQLLLLDEPTVGLDIKARADILAHVRDLVARENLAVLWTTHLIDEIAPQDQVIVLHHGRVLANGSARDIVEAKGAATIGEAFEMLTVARGDA